MRAWTEQIDRIWKNWAFPACLFDLEHQSSLAISTPGSQVFRPRLESTSLAPLVLSLWTWTKLYHQLSWLSSLQRADCELCSLHNCKSQLFIINIFLCTFFWFCFSRETYTLSYTLSRISSMWLCFPNSYSPDYCNKFFLLVFLLPWLSHFITSELYSVFLLCVLSNIQACQMV